MSHNVIPIRGAQRAPDVLSAVADMNPDFVAVFYMKKIDGAYEYATSFSECRDLHLVIGALERLKHELVRNSSDEV